MKLRAFSLLLLMATLATSAGIINKTYNFSPSQVEVSTLTQPQNSASDYVPMVVEGKTWWQEIDGQLNRWYGPYVKHEVGITIGSEVVINEEKWNKVYISHYRDLNAHPEGAKFTEDDITFAYIRESDKRVYVMLKTDWTDDQGEFFKTNLGPYAGFTPWYIHYMYDDGFEPFMVYDFNKSNYYLGKSDINPNYQHYTWKCQFVDQNIITNSGMDYPIYTYDVVTESDELHRTEMVEGVGLTKSLNARFHNLFPLPFANSERYALNRMILRYVTDKDYNILFEQAGGVKLWDEMAGVGNVSTDRSSCGEPVWYNLQGIKVAEPTTPGIYIRKIGNETEKVVVK